MVISPSFSTITLGNSVVGARDRSEIGLMEPGLRPSATWRDQLAFETLTRWFLGWRRLAGLRQYPVRE